MSVSCVDLPGERDMFLVGNPSDIGYIGKIWLKFRPDLARKTRKTWFLVFSAGGNRIVPMREVRPQIYSFLARLQKMVFFLRGWNIYTAGS